MNLILVDDLCINYDVYIFSTLNGIQIQSHEFILNSITGVF